MKKKFVFVILFFITSTLSFVHAWVDPYGRGMADVSYLGTNKTVDIQSEISEARTRMINMGGKCRPVEKMTKLEESFVNQGLSSDFNLKSGEVYFVIIGTTEGLPWVTAIIVEIDSVSNDGSFRWSWWDIGRSRL